MNKVIAISGTGGFIGRRLVAGMVEIGWSIRAITSHPGNIPENPRTEIIECDWTSEGIKAAVERAKEAGLWVHAAARVDFGDETLLELYTDNALKAEMLASEIKSVSREMRLVYLSSISVYGSNQKMAVNTEPQPDSHYGLSKLLGEKLCQAVLGDRCLALRLAGVWGSEQKPKLFINRCLQQARAGKPLTIKGGGEGRRNYLWVGDIPRIITQAYKEKWHGIRLAAGPRALSMFEMADAIGKQFGVPLQFETKEGTFVERDMIVEASPGLALTDFSNALKIEAGEGR